MGKPSKGTPADKRLKANKTSGGGRSGSASTTARASGSAPKFGSPAWNAKYGIKPRGKK